MDMHNAYGLTEPVVVQIESYYERNSKVIFVDKIAAAAAKKLVGHGVGAFSPYG